MGLHLVGVHLIDTYFMDVYTVLPTSRTKSLAWAGLVGLMGRALMPNVM
jgi:hypothetical protein